MTSVKIYLQQSYIDFKISPTKTYVHIRTSQARKCAMPLVWRYQAKLTWDIHKNKRSNFFKIFQFYGFLNFWTHSKTEHEMENQPKKKNKAKVSVRNMNKQKHMRPMQQVCNKEQKVHTRDKVQGMIPTPMVLRKVSNFRSSRGLVNMSTF